MKDVERVYGNQFGKRSVLNKALSFIKNNFVHFSLMIIKNDNLTIEAFNL